MIDTETRKALVTYVVQNVSTTKPIGKKAAQKFLHLIEDAAKVQTGYEFSIYTYGPFSRTLASEIDALASSKALNVFFDNQYGTYEISPGVAAKEAIQKGENYILEHKPKIDDILSKLRGKSGRELELYSTLVFLMSHVDSLDTDSKIVDKLLSIKPKYEKEEVKKTLLESKRLMAVV